MIACGRRVRDGYYACARIVREYGDRPSLAASQTLNESTVLVNQQAAAAAGLLEAPEVCAKV